MKDLSRTQREVLGVLELCGRTHAYEIKVRLRDVLRHSSVYAALARAEAKGYVTAEWEDISERPPGNGPPRKYYAMTEAGREALELACRDDDSEEFALAPAMASEAELA
jgi:DNA-binding PadR family transcriptional regulator